MKKVFLLILALLAINEVYAVTMGIMPNVVDLGVVERGKTYVGEIYVVSREPVSTLVYVKPGTVPQDLFNPNLPRSYRFEIEEASQEECDGWISVMENPVVVKPVITRMMWEGTQIKASKRITFLLKVPEDAEPGYHLASLLLSPKEKSGGAGIGVDINVVVIPLVVFRVEGVAVRSGYITHFDSPRISQGTERIIVFFKNNGTVSVTARIRSLEVYNSTDNKLLARLSGPYVLTKPGKSYQLWVDWNVEGVPEGTYRVKAIVDWLTGEAEKEGLIELRPYVPVVGKVVKPEERKPIIYVLLLVLLLFVYLEWRRRR